ncbi:MAG TPA: amino acid racemase [Woeseiaceae bacterium]|nr:amino acid racemase [Woeseiaceae bacterium]
MSGGQLTVGVLGGMGPDATVDFMAKVIALTRAERDQDHVRMLVEHNPKVPNRQAAIASGDPAVGRVLADMARRLEHAGADFLVMPCNSAHAFLEPIRQAASIPFVSIIAETVAEVGRVLPGARRIGVLQTDGLQQAGLYEEALRRAGHTALVLREDEIGELMRYIHRIKAGDRSDEVGRGVASLANALAGRGAEAILAACTEIPLVLFPADAEVPLLASTDVLARRTVELATGAAPLPD